ncbi:IS701 family transposase [Streptomyces sp. NPDC050161]|uniref:IS701 family transposase n=1 Tax=Streptomyces sp. NPDC050161 TaxID=3365604 RepID=UPI0037AFA748
MVVHRSRHTPAATDAAVRLFADELFAHLPRADQRRWAREYLLALLVTPGKKTMRNLAGAVSGAPGAPHSLRQFLNASPWDWQPVRQFLARWVAHRLSPQAWTIALAVLPKRGEHSVGVHRRFVPEAGRTVNCQLGIGAFLSSAEAHVPVDWRLVLPECWTSETRLLRHARVPAGTRHEPLPAHALGLITALADAVNLPSAPVLADMRAVPEAGELISALLDMRRDFVVEVAGNTPVRPALGACAAAGDDGSRAAALPAYQAPRLFAHHPAVTTTVALREGGDRPVRVVSCPIRPPGEDTVRARPLSACRLIAEIPGRGGGASRFWITNRVRGRLDETHSLARLSDTTCAALRHLEEDFGLMDFEGRSFPGWHHHMTMVSAAYAYRQLSAPVGLREAGHPHRPGRTGTAGVAGTARMTRASEDR